MITGAFIGGAVGGAIVALFAFWYGFSEGQKFERRLQGICDIVNERVK